MKARSLLPLLALLLLIPTEANAIEMNRRVRGAALRVNALPIAVGAVPRGVQRLSLLRFSLRASCAGDVTVSSVRVRRAGMGDVQFIRRVYLLDGFRRLSRGTRVSTADQTAVLRPRRPFVIPACKTVALDVAADIDSAAPSGSVFGFIVQQPEDIESSTQFILGKFPLKNEGGGSVSTRDTGTVTVTFVPIQKSLRALRNQPIAKLRIAADDKAHQVINAITFTNNGTAKNDEIRNLFVSRTDGRPLTNTAKQMQKDEVTLAFTKPFFLRRSQELLFELRGTAWRRSKTVDFILKEPSDLKTTPSWRSGRVRRTRR